MSEKQQTMYEKLVRDGIPQVIRDSGAEPHIRVLSPEEFVPAAIDKLLEEAGELKAAQGDDRLLERSRHDQARRRRRALTRSVPGN